MAGKRHPWGCTCRSHVDRPWNRPEHWKLREVDLLERWYGHMTDAAIAWRLGRTVVGVQLKARRLRLHKRSAGLTARSFAQIFGIDASTVVKVWIRRGLLPAHYVAVRACDGRPVHWIIPTDAAEAFIAEHPELVDVDKMPPSWYRDLAARDPWISLPEVHRRTGRDLHAVALMVRGGVIEGRRRGPHWFVPVRELAKIRHLTPEAIDESVFRRETILQVRRDRRKGIWPRQFAPVGAGA